MTLVSGLLFNVGVNGTDTIEAGDWEGYLKFIEQRDDTIICEATWLFNEFYLKTVLLKLIYLCLNTRI